MRRAISIAATLILLTTACSSFGKPGGAAALLPDVPNARTVEGKTITQHIASLAGGDALKIANPELYAVVQFTEGVVTCYQDLGAIAVRVYSDADFALSAGMVAIVDRNAITSLENAVKCLGGSLPFSTTEPPAIRPCFYSYTLKRDGNEFYIAYVGTTAEMCQAFCTRLEGCAESQR